MSSVTAGDITPQQFLTLLGSSLEGLTLRNCCGAAGAVLFYHLWLLSFARECEFVWFCRPNVGSVFYILSRYPTMISATLGLLSNMVLLPHIPCHVLFNATQALAMMGRGGQFGLICVVTWPLIKRREWFLGGILLTGFIQLFIQVFMFFTSTCAIDNVMFLGPVLHKQSDLRVFIEMSHFLFETIAFGAVLSHTWTLYIGTLDRPSKDTGLVCLMTETGILRIFILWFFTITNGILWKMLPPPMLGLIDIIRTALTTVSICDWYLDFCEIKRDMYTLSSASEPKFTTQPATALESSQIATGVSEETQTQQEIAYDYLATEQTQTQLNQKTGDTDSQVMTYTDRGDGTWVQRRRQKRIQALERLRALLTNQ